VRYFRHWMKSSTQGYSTQQNYHSELMER
jgi:hypothetical protein